MSWIEQPAQEIFQYEDKIFNLSQLAINEYYITYNLSVPNKNDFQLFTKKDECYRCPYHLFSGFPILHKMNSQWSTRWRILDGNNSLVCELQPAVGEFGVYQLDIEQNSCKLHTLLEPVNIYLPILTVLLILLGISLFAFIVYKIINRNKSKDDEEINQITKKPRVQSLDTFRGISIVVMILANYGAGHYNFLEHATWNGLNVADLVFPWFMWIMGVCIPISVKSALKRNEQLIFYNILRRSCILFLLGLSLNRVRILDHIRIFGVLQRFSICYLFVATLNLIFTKRNYFQMESKYFQDIVTLIPQWIVVLIVLAIHTACTFLINAPGCPKGYLGPGGIHEDGKYENCTGGAAGYIDKQILGLNHMYKYPTSYTIYGGVAFDPEGIFGTLTSVVQVFLGVQAGTILLTYESHKTRLIRWFVWGAAAGLLGGILCGFSQEDGIIPVNKNLWSLSFVLVTSCFAYILLTGLYIVIDILKWWTGKPFIFAGMNATIMYVGHSLTHNMFPFQWGLLQTNLHFQLFAQAVWGTSLWVLIAYWLFQNKFFLSI